MLSDPIPSLVSPAIAAPAVAIARDRDGVAIAWTVKVGLDARVCVARLDAAGRIAGAVTTLPIASVVTADAEFPTLAPLPGGSGFTLAWIEGTLPPVVWRVVVCQLDAALHPSALLAPYHLFSIALQPVIVRSDATTTWMTAGGWVWKVTASDTLPMDITIKASDMAIVDDQPLLTGGESVKEVFCYTQFGFCLDPNPYIRYTTRLDFTSAFHATPKSVSWPYVTSARPALGSNGRDVLMVWYDGAQLAGGNVVALHMSRQAWDYPNLTAPPLHLGTFGRDSDPTRPDIASDGSRYLVVWRTANADGTHDIAGAALDADGGVTPLSIASTSADERDPAVVTLGSGLFLIAYECDRGGERRIATRLVNLVPHRRAVRY